MSRKFKGDNSEDSASKLWFDRAKFKIEAHQENNGLGGPQIKDVGFVERAYYGMIDHQDIPVYPREDLMKTLKQTRGNPGGVPRALDFVADAFSDAQKSFKYACNANLISKENPHLINLKAVKAYVPPRVDYERYLKKLLMNLNTDVIKRLYDPNKITRFEHYVNVFLHYFSKNPHDTPLTFSKWCRSQNSGIFHSGLAIDIAGLDFGTDQPKIDVFIDNPTYEMYSNIMMNKGFSIHRNAPNVLIADLLSPAMAPYLGEYNLSNGLEDIFNTRFIKCNTIDIELLKTNMFNYYNYFIIENRNIKEITVCNGTTSFSTKRKRNISFTEFEKKYSDEYWYKVYLTIRNHEDQVGFNDFRIKKIAKKAYSLQKNLDKESAMSYIEKEYGNLTWSKDYGYDDLLKRQKELSGVKAENEVKSQAGQGSTSGAGSNY